MRFNPKSGKTYEDQYGGWLEFFRIIAEGNEKGPINVEGVPRCWVPLITYLGGVVTSSTVHFECDELLPPTTIMLEMYRAAAAKGLAREFVESYCTWRPELVDAMYKADMEWPTMPRLRNIRPEFVVTNNGSFHRPEVLEFFQLMMEHELESKHGIVLVPCAADKPYPSALHAAVRANIPADYRIAVVTGVFGVVPEEYWPIMPNYDSGVPNRWRAMKGVELHFAKYNYKDIVVYSDFYSEAIAFGLKNAGFLERAFFPLEDAGVWKRGSTGYIDLRKPEHLELLRECTT